MWRRRSDLAIRRGGARFESGAGIFALAVDAGLERRAVRVRLAAHVDVDAGAGRVRRALEADGTLADGRVVERFAFDVLGTSVGHGARISAPAVEAGPVRSAVVEVGAADGLAAGGRIASGAGRALADGFVLHSAAGGSADAGGRIADVFAVAVDAGVRSGTLFVHPAADLETGDQWIAGLAVRTGADGFAVDDAADGSRGAVARSFAHSVAASLFRRAFVVRFASDDLVLVHLDGGNAAAVAVEETVGRALADDRAEWRAVHDAAQLVLAARLDSARVHAPLVDADLFAGTLRIGSALRSRWTDGRDDHVGDAADEWVASLSGRTSTDGLVFPSGTDGRRGARDRLTDLDADAVEAVAHFGRVAIVVALAADGDADDGGIALHSGRAVALGSMECDAAEAVGAALVAHDARVETFAADAGAIRRAVFVSFAFRWKRKHCHFIRIPSAFPIENLRRKQFSLGSPPHPSGQKQTGRCC